MARSTASLSTTPDLWRRLLSAGPAGLDDLEALQLGAGLSSAEAEALIGDFGSLPEVLVADVAALRRCVSPRRAMQLALLCDLARRQLEAPLRRRPVLSGWDATADYLRVVLRGRPREQLHGLFLDRRNRLIRDEILTHGTVDHVPIYPREILRRALIGQTDEPAQDIYIAQVAGEGGHHLTMEQVLVLVGQGDAFRQGVAANQAGTLLPVYPAKVISCDLHRDTGQEGLRAVPVDGVLRYAEESFLG